MKRRNFIYEILEDSEKIPLDYDVYIIANAQNKTRHISPQGLHHTSEDEFFSRAEFAEIASAIFEVFGFVKVFYSELEFIRYVQINNIKSIECVVYNLARDGLSEGKKSLIPAFCDLYGLNYTGSNAFVISLIRNKFIYSTFLQAFGIPVPATWKFDYNSGFLPKEPPINTKIIAKNIAESASIGLSAENIFIYQKNIGQDVLKKICMQMTTSELLVQTFIEGLECEVLVLKKGEQYLALDPIKINIHNSKILDSQTSNLYDYSFTLLENELSSEVCNLICSYAESAASLLGIDDYARFDFRIDNKQNIFLIDIAGTPYTIKHSSVAFLYQKVYGLKYSDIYRTIVYLTLLNH